MRQMIFVVCAIAMLFIGCEKKATKQTVTGTLDTYNQSVPTQTELTLMDRPENAIQNQTAPGSASQTGSSMQVGVGATIPAAPAVSASAMDLKSVTTKEIQQALKNANLYEGKIDGSLGPKTKKSIMKFQEQNGLKADGKVGAKTWMKLSPFLNQTPEPQAQELKE